MKPQHLRIFCCHFTDEDTKAPGGRGGVEWNQVWSQSCLLTPPPTAHNSFFSSFVVLPGTKKPQLFSDQNVFHNKPSGAFLCRAGTRLCALLAVLLLVSVKMEVFDANSEVKQNQTPEASRNSVRTLDPEPGHASSSLFSVSLLPRSSHGCPSILKPSKLPAPSS